MLPTLPDLHLSEGTKLALEDAGGLLLSVSVSLSTTPELHENVDPRGPMNLFLPSDFSPWLSQRTEGASHEADPVE